MNELQWWNKQEKTTTEQNDKWFHDERIAKKGIWSKSYKNNINWEGTSNIDTP